MELYVRIKARREQLKMSQDQLAQKLGYSDRSTIAKIERGINDISQSKISAFAEALKTTPAYLMGWTSNPELDYTEIKTQPSEEDKAYFAVMKSAQNEGFSAADIDLALDFLRRARQRDEEAD